MLFCIGMAFITPVSFGQANPFINVLPSNSGIVAVGGTIDIEVTIGNTGPVSAIPQAKLRPIIDVPPSVTFLSNAQQTGIPAGWTILSNTGSQLRICNSTDPIPVNTSRTIILKVQGVTVSPPQTFSGNINFGNGTTCAAGPTVSGDNIIDNSALSTIEVVSIVLPVILTKFSVHSDNCTTHLSWSTFSEMNCDRIEIERSETKDGNWQTIGSVKSHGSSSTNFTYYYQDDKESLKNTVVLYRLKIIDIDGSFIYSPVEDVIFQCDEQSLSVFPNPLTDGKLHVSVKSGENVEAVLSSATGQLVKRMTLKNGINYMDVSELSNGVYILSAKFAHGVNQSVKISIQK